MTSHILHFNKVLTVTGFYNIWFPINFSDPKCHFLTPCSLQSHWPPCCSSASPAYSYLRAFALSALSTDNILISDSSKAPSLHQVFTQMPQSQEASCDLIFKTLIFIVSSHQSCSLAQALFVYVLPIHYHTHYCFIYLKSFFLQECKLHEGRAFCLVWTMLYPQTLEQCLAQWEYTP